MSMELPVTDEDLVEIVGALPADSALRHRLQLVAQVRAENPRGPWKKILREQHNMTI